MGGVGKLIKGKKGWRCFLEALFKFRANDRKIWNLVQGTHLVFWFELNWKLTIIFDLRLLLISAWISSYFKGVVSLAITGNPKKLKLATDLLQRVTFLKMLFVILFNQILVFRPAIILEKVMIYILNLVWRAAISFQTLQTIETSQKITSNASPNKSSLENNYAWYIIADSRIRWKSQ